jgi:hypothetical protein
MLSDQSILSALFLFLFFRHYLYEAPSVLFRDASIRLAFGVGSLRALANLEQFREKVVFTRVQICRP